MKRILSVIIVILLLTGCARVTELDEKSFVTAIGIDKGTKYNLRFTFVFTTPAKSSSSSDPKEKDEVIVIEAPSLYSATEQIDNFKSKKIELTHTQTVIFSEELAKEGLKEYIFMLVRSGHFRPNTYVCVAKGTSMEFLEKVNPSQTYHLEKYFQLLFEKMTSGRKGDMYLYDSYFRILNSSGASVLPYCAINKTKLKEPEDKKGEEASEPSSEEEAKGDGKFSENTDDFAINTVAGDIISKSDNSAEIQGVAVLKDGKMISLLGRVEAISLQLVTNSFPDTYLTLSNPDFPDKMIACLISQKENSKIKVKCDDKPLIEVEINLEGDFSEVGEHSEYIKEPKRFEEYFELKTKEAVTRFLEKTSKKLNSDICGFSEVAKGHFLTIDQWEKYNWNEKYSSAEFKVKINLTMRSYGELSQHHRE